MPGVKISMPGKNKKAALLNAAHGI